jgi:hypothetical protein
MSPIKPIDKVPVPAPLDRSAGIGRASQNVLVRFIVETFNRLRDGISDTLRHAADNIAETWERPLVEMAGPIIDEVLDKPGLPASVRAALERTRSGTDQVAVGGLLIALAAVMIMLIPAMLSGVTATIGQISYYLTRPFLLGYATWRAATLRDPSLRGTMNDDLRNQGWREDQIVAADLASEQRLGINEIIVANHRGEFSNFDAITRMLQLGVSGVDADILFELGKQIPGPGDLVRFGLREVWRDDIAAQYGYDEGQPAEMTEWMAKQGFGPEWAKAFWRSHWVIPSVGQMIEMFHRREIDSSQLVQGLKTNDVAPGWIDPLLGITYKLLTRVDVKRALRYGLYTVPEVENEYRLLGYDDRRAGILTNIAVKETIDDAAGLTRAAIIKAYKKGRMLRGEAIESLGDVGILGEIAGFYLDQADFDRADEILDRKVGQVEKRYKAGLLTDQQALEMMGSLGVGGSEARLNVDDWALSRKTQVKKPTRANLDEFFTQGIVGVETYREQLAGLGYDEQYVGWYLGSLAFESAKKAAAEEERAQKERARVVADRRASEYEKAKAEIDQDIAELNAAIADSQVALVEAQNERDQALSRTLSVRALAELAKEYQPLFREVDSAIAQARLSIRQVQGEIQERTSEINGLRRSLAAGRDIVEDTVLRNERAAALTETALLGQQIAQKRTDIARLAEAALLMETPEEKADAKAADLAFKTEIREFQERQAEIGVRTKEIDELLPVQLTAERRAEIESRVRALQAEIDEFRLEIEDLDEGIRQTQVERLEIETRYQGLVGQVPGRVEQVTIRAEWESRIDVIQARVAELRANVADRRLAKIGLTVEWRS